MVNEVQRQYLKTLLACPTNINKMKLQLPSWLYIQYFLGRLCLERTLQSVIVKGY